MRQQFESIEAIRSFFDQDQMARKCLGAVVDSYDWETGETVVSMELDERHHNGFGSVMIIGLHNHPEHGTAQSTVRETVGKYCG